VCDSRISSRKFVLLQMMEMLLTNYQDNAQAQQCAPEPGCRNRQVNEWFECKPKPTHAAYICKYVWAPLPQQKLASRPELTKLSSCSGLGYLFMQAWMYRIC
jgi:hypothetical protein